MVLPASLESVRSRKDVSEDVIITLTFHVWCSAEDIGRINELYKKPITLHIQEAKT